MQASLTKQRIGPGGILGVQGRHGRNTVIDVVVSAVVVALVENRLQVDRRLGILGSERNPNHRKRYAKRNPMHAQEIGVPRSPRPDQIGPVVRRGDLSGLAGKQRFSISQEINFNNVYVASHHIFSFIDVEPASFARAFVRWVDHLDRGDDAAARPQVDDLDVTLGLGLEADIDQEVIAGGGFGLRHGGAPSLGTPTWPLDHADIGIMGSSGLSSRRAEKPERGEWLNVEATTGGGTRGPSSRPQTPPPSLLL